MREREHQEAEGGADSGRRAGLPSLQPQEVRSTCQGASRNPAWTELSPELLISPAAYTDVKMLSGPEMNPSLFVSKSGVWMAQDRWGDWVVGKEVCMDHGTLTGCVQPPKGIMSKFLQSKCNFIWKKGFADVTKLNIFLYYYFKSFI